MRIFSAVLILAAFAACNPTRDGNDEDYTRVTPDVNGDVTVDLNELVASRDTLRLPDEPLIGSVTQIDVSDDGRILLSDQFRNSVYLYDIASHQMKALSPDACHESLNWVPLDARFGPGRIYVMNNGPWGYLFSSAGDCEGEVDESFSLPRDIAFADDGTMYGYYPGPTGVELRIMDESGGLIEAVPMEVSLPHLTGRVGSGGIDADNAYVYVSVSTDPHLHRYDRSNGRVERIAWTPPRFRSASGPDIDPGLPSEELFPAVRDLLRQSSLAARVYFLNNGMIVHQHFNSYLPQDDARRYSLSFISSSSTPRVISHTFVDRPIAYARDNRLYRVILPDDIEGVSNPMIEIIELKFDSGGSYE